ncbi:hypothetical protein CDL15_Pgr014574 [Punica granatum]|uniref:Uncharacterized protein n=1 Tax=Punica granatum TaxID=22663 RepID=A0A218WFA8_PUNGR|nr:hypothetical protein CDL15_Pgr014574 [Punica granatum]PKI33399.1 hypothetical protein CRG98_046207 [Punica granatum]
MAAKPWETRLMEKSQSDQSETTPTSKILSSRKKHEILGATSGQSPEEQCYHENLSKASVSSSFCTSATPASGFTGLTSEGTEDSSHTRPSYMNLTKSTKAT